MKMNFYKILKHYEKTRFQNKKKQKINIMVEGSMNYHLAILHPNIHMIIPYIKFSFSSSQNNWNGHISITQRVV